MLRQLLQDTSVALNDRFLLSLLRCEDIPDIIEMLSDPVVTEYLFFAPSPVEVYEGYFTPLAEAIDAARQQDKLPASVVLTVRCTDSGDFVGDIGLLPTVFCPGNFEIGFQIRREFHGQGIATAAARLLTRIAFDELGAHKVCADLYEGNVASARVLQKLGYVKEGQLKAYYKTKRRVRGQDILRYVSRSVHSEWCLAGGLTPWPKSLHSRLLPIFSSLVSLKRESNRIQRKIWD